MTMMIKTTMNGNYDRDNHSMSSFIDKFYNNIITATTFSTHLLVLFIMYKSVQSKPKSDSMNHFSNNINRHIIVQVIGDIKLH